MRVRPPLVVRLYGAALGCLPPSTRRADGEEILRAFEDQWRAAGGRGVRTKVAWRAFRRLPVAVVMEWLEVIGPGSATVRENQRRTTMRGWARNFRFALRTLGKARGFTATTVLLLALGVGSVTTIFTIVDHVLLRDLPYPQQDRLILLENGSHSGPQWREVQSLNSVERWAAIWSDEANMVGEGDPAKVGEAKVSEGFFGLLGARPALGRLLLEEDYAAADVAVLGYGAWQRFFGADPGVIGRSLHLDNASYTVVGVLAASFVAPQGIIGHQSPDVWIPIDWSDSRMEEGGFHVLEILGRLAPGAALADAANEMEAVSARLAEQYENLRRRDGTPYETPPAYLRELSTRRVRAGLGLLMGAVGLLLLVACLNVAHLFLARGLSRVREMAVRRALGAETGSLVGQLLTESVLVGLAGGALGALIALVGVDAILTLSPEAIPWADGVEIDLRVLGFTAAVSVGTALIFGLVPALRAVDLDLNEELKGSARSATAGRGASRARGALVVAEVAVSLVLVAQAGLLVKSFRNVNRHDPGITTAQLVTVPLTAAVESPEEYLEIARRVEASLAALPAVATAGYGLSMPFEFTGGGRCCWNTGSIRADGEPLADTRLWLQPVSRGYFEALELPLLAGAVWADAEATQEPWAGVLTEGLAVELFGSSERAVNQIVEVGGAGTRVRVVGVAADVRHYGLDQDPPTALYLPIEHLPFAIPLMHMAVRLRGPASDGLARDLREAVWAAAPDLPVPTVRSMQEWIDLSTAGRRFDSVLFGAFGSLALILAAAGLYGTLLYTVGQQRRELGIRLALGAARGLVERRIVARGLVLATVGSAIGLAGAWAGSRYLQSKLYGLEATDLGTMTVAVVVLMGTAVLASWLPARRAGRTDPLETLRAE